MCDGQGYAAKCVTKWINMTNPQPLLCSSSPHISFLLIVHMYTRSSLETGECNPAAMCHATVLVQYILLYLIQ